MVICGADSDMGAVDGCGADGMGRVTEASAL